MIAPTIIRALQLRGAALYSVTVGMQTHVFATREGAVRFAATLDGLAGPRSVPVVRREPAVHFDVDGHRVSAAHLAAPGDVVEVSR